MELGGRERPSVPADRGAQAAWHRSPELVSLALPAESTDWQYVVRRVLPSPNDGETADVIAPSPTRMACGQPDSR